MTKKNHAKRRCELRHRLRHVTFNISLPLPEFVAIHSFQNRLCYWMRASLCISRFATCKFCCRNSVVSTAVRSQKSSHKNGDKPGGSVRRNSVKRGRPNVRPNVRPKQVHAPHKQYGDNFTMVEKRAQTPQESAASMTSETAAGERENGKTYDIPPAPPLPKILGGGGGSGVGVGDVRNATSQTAYSACSNNNDIYATTITSQRETTRTANVDDDVRAGTHQEKDHMYCTKITERARTPDDLRGTSSDVTG